MVLAHRLFTPRDIERHNLNTPRGSGRGGGYHPDQLGTNRPLPALSGYRTPVAGLYLCGSSAAGGAGVNSAPGYNAAGVIAGDLSQGRWWPAMPEPAWGGEAGEAVVALRTEQVPRPAAGDEGFGVGHRHVRQRAGGGGNLEAQRRGRALISTWTGSSVGRTEVSVEFDHGVISVLTVEAR